MIQKLLSIPANLVKYFHEITHKDPQEWFCASDPIGCKIGSGGGTTCRPKASPRFRSGRPSSR